MNKMRSNIGIRIYDKNEKEASDGDIIQDNNGNTYEVYWHEEYQWSKRNYPKNEYGAKNFQGTLTSSKFIVPEEMKWEIIGGNCNERLICDKCGEEKEINGVSGYCDDCRLKNR